MKLLGFGADRAPAPTAGATTRDGAAAVRVKDLHVGYGDITVLRGVSLDVREGEIVALLGPNGAGKTTLLNAIAGHLAPSSGQIELFGGPAASQPHIRARRGLAYIADDRNLLPSLSVRQYLRMVGHTPDELFELFPELGAKSSVRAGLLSGGQQQMAALGTAILRKAGVMVIDELSLGLAPIIRDRLLGQLRQAADNGAAILLVEQSVRAALGVANRACVLSHGAIVAEHSSHDWAEQLDDLSEWFVT